MYKISDDELLQELKMRFQENKKALDELQVLNEELKTANKKLEESEALKSHFIANIANEIRNPLASILGFASSILSADEKDWRDIMPMISHIYSEVFYLDFQFKNIFIAAKLEAGQIAPEICKIDIRSILLNLIESFKYEAEMKNISIVINNGADRKNSIYFKSDSEKLKLILSNLLSNAIKYSYKDSKIDINYKIKGKKMTISVQDYGEGISRANQKIIFDRFKRADSGINSLNRGHGLGLSVNKALLEILDGKIEVKTEMNKGTIFTILLPEATAEITGISGDDNEVIFNTSEDGDIF
ncbi:MAG: HAMP domain-containing histidine kinase [Bacteroidales bacterium]|nr:MAG: HAMP domain-containing histidine kinase [Bacteroidales bacterium]